jgi:hypothetical protein
MRDLLGSQQLSLQRHPRVSLPLSQADSLRSNPLTILLLNPLSNLLGNLPRSLSAILPVTHLHNQHYNRSENHRSIHPGSLLASLPANLHNNRLSSQMLCRPLYPLFRRLDSHLSFPRRNQHLNLLHSHLVSRAFNPLPSRLGNHAVPRVSNQADYPLANHPEFQLAVHHLNLLADQPINQLLNHPSNRNPIQVCSHRGSLEGFLQRNLAPYPLPDRLGNQPNSLRRNLLEFPA